MEVDLTINLSGLMSLPIFISNSPEFSVVTTNCIQLASCTFGIVFQPSKPGLRQATIHILDSSNNLISLWPMVGIGNAPLAQMQPGMLSTMVGQSGNSGPPTAGLGTTINLQTPEALCLAPDGNMFIADALANVVLKLDLQSNIVTIVAGTGTYGYSGDGGSALLAELASPTGLALDISGNLYVADLGNNRIRMIKAIDNTIETIAGGGGSQAGNDGLGDGGQATIASLNGPSGVAVDIAGNFYIADTYNNLIRKVDTSGIIQILAGCARTVCNGGSDGVGDDLPANQATLLYPGALALNTMQNKLYIADTYNHIIRSIDLSSGLITRVAGSAGVSGFGGDGGASTASTLNAPSGVTLDAGENLYISDTNNAVLRRIEASTGTIQTIAGSPGSVGYSSSGISSEIVLASPSGVAVDGSTLWISDSANSVVQEITYSGATISFPVSLQISTQTVIPLTLSNAGNQPMNISAISTSNGFSYSGSCPNNGALGLGASCSVNVLFSPIVVGLQTGQISFLDDSLNHGSSQVISLSGTNPYSGPIGSLTNGSVGFTPTLLGSTTAPQTITLSNTGTGTLDLNGISINGANATDFTQTNNCASTLAPGAQCSINITFTPSGTGSRLATLIITDNSGNVINFTQSTALSGTGTNGAAGAISSTSLFFNSVLGNGSVGQPLTVTNSGTGSLIVSGTFLSGNNSADFSVSGNCGAPLATTQSCSFSVYFSAAASGIRTAALTIVDNGPRSPHIVLLSGIGPNTPLQFVPVAPCRLLDTRLPVSPFGGPLLAAFVPRDFRIPNSVCQIPANAAAYSINVTAVPSAPLGALAIWPTGLRQPLVSTLNSDGRIKANAAIVPAGVGGGIELSVSQPSHAVVDINGYFVAGSSLALNFYPLTPCRIVDTRFSTGAFGPPYMSAQTTRTFPVLASPCNVPSSAQAYSLNFTVVPHVPLSYITVWPTGQSQPLVSTLNAPTGVTTANAAIVPAGIGGSINVLATNDTDLIIDIDGYFAPSSSTGLSLYNLTPCRLLDTRLANGAFTGTLNVNVSGSACNAPSTAQSYVLNATVVPVQPLGALTMWATGGLFPLASTLNSIDGVVMSNLAFVPDSNGSISASASNPSQLILDISGYFAP